MPEIFKAAQSGHIGIELTYTLGILHRQLAAFGETLGMQHGGDIDIGAVEIGQLQDLERGVATANRQRVSAKRFDGAGHRGGSVDRLRLPCQQHVPTKIHFRQHHGVWVGTEIQRLDDAIKLGRRLAPVQHRGRRWATVETKVTAQRQVLLLRLQKLDRELIEQRRKALKARFDWEIPT